MEKIIHKKRKSYAIVLILLISSLSPLFSILSTATVTTNSRSEQSTNNMADDTEYWALLVGAGDYAENPMEDRPDMILEVNDFYAHLLHSDWWPADHIKVLTGEDATVVNIIAGLRWLDRMEDSNDISLVYLSTHGFPLGFDIPPKDEADGTDEALVTYWGFSFPSLVIWDDELNVLLNRLESKGVCLIVDSCYAGGFNDPPNWNITDIPTDSQHQMAYGAEEWAKGFGEDVRGQKRVVLMGSCEDEEAVSGGFGPYLVDGIRGYADSNGDGIISAEEVFYYAQPRSAQMQHPTLYDGYDGELPIMTVQSSEQSVDTNRFVQINTRKDDTNGDPLLQSVETSILCGYVQDAATNVSIENAVVSVRGRINEYEFYENQTTTDSTGFFQMHTPAIRLRATASSGGYCDRSVGPYQMEENETQWANISLYERPQETATVCGFIMDGETTDPVELANVSLSWEGSEHQYYENMTTTENNGFYHLNVAAGNISLNIEKEGYFSEYIEELSVDDSETLWVNVSLHPCPAETAIVCGYLSDNDTGEPLSGAWLEFEWFDAETGSSYGKETQTNTSGFYSITIAPGEIYMYIHGMGYEYYDPYRHDAFENTTVWLNCSLTRSTIEVEFNKPLNALYLKNQRVMPWKTPRIIGPLDVAAYIPGGWGEPGDAEKVEFYVDGVLQATLTEQPYNWTWSQRSVGKHILKVIAYDFNGDSASKEIEVTKFL
ncbi:MAG TPA: carboxypeptidase regulatory-like domain-containing protein [Candidatus Thermoplasmatota archaeon]|nr:carboxypeptidase regulatory-like domain-containing protein [Candidatus Thermoplasmatota archaeon]